MSSYMIVCECIISDQSLRSLQLPKISRKVLKDDKRWHNILLYLKDGDRYGTTVVDTRCIHTLVQ